MTTWDNETILAAMANKKQIENELCAELGIDIPTLFCALKHGFYGVLTNPAISDVISYCPASEICFGLEKGEWALMIAVDFDGQKLIQVYNTRDYGKTWALNQAELETAGE